ncbi:hypothetical protein SARC_09834 [Sphaeroforma arctica JP610]|uniref:RGS domain-containing protein n=1 Tax=Sphaeroforma arctica JP610 TaxID=667725 RepID=A0A0L0FLQ7_9EUKA|nr:hypothetical protein SARC_09834 [Sphaeroforma arctica JP610]KNC77712.1 hypothetical protein SARC_09834 [Sphaeroforma arctica JP610]|eukprot:XP_014151614.1 hypothetical protein SARC_09834 [Sphaeroforma arctica JP610]
MDPKEIMSLTSPVPAAPTSKMKGVHSMPPSNSGNIFSFHHYGSTHKSIRKKLSVDSHRNSKPQLTPPPLREVLTYDDDNFSNVRLSFLQYAKNKAFEENVLFLLDFERLLGDGILCDDGVVVKRYLWYRLSVCHDHIMRNQEARAVRLLAVICWRLSAGQNTHITLEHAAQSDYEKLFSNLSRVAKQIFNILEVGTYAKFLEEYDANASCPDALQDASSSRKLQLRLLNSFGSAESDQSTSTQSSVNRRSSTRSNRSGHSPMVSSKSSPTQLGGAEDSGILHNTSVSPRARTHASTGSGAYAKFRSKSSVHVRGSNKEGGPTDSRRSSRRSASTTGASANAGSAAPDKTTMQRTGSISKVCSVCMSLLSSRLGHSSTTSGATSSEAVDPSRVVGPVATTPGMSAALNTRAHSAACTHSLERSPEFMRNGKEGGVPIAMSGRCVKHQLLQQSKSHTGTSESARLESIMGTDDPALSSEESDAESDDATGSATEDVYHSTEDTGPGTNSGESGGEWLSAQTESRRSRWLPLGRSLTPSALRTAADGIADMALHSVSHDTQANKNRVGEGKGHCNKPCCKKKGKATKSVRRQHSSGAKCRGDERAENISDPASVSGSSTIDESGTHPAHPRNKVERTRSNASASSSGMFAWLRNTSGISYSRRGSAADNSVESGPSPSEASSEWDGHPESRRKSPKSGAKTPKLGAIKSHTPVLGSAQSSPKLTGNSPLRRSSTMEGTYGMSRNRGRQSSPERVWEASPRQLAVADRKRSNDAGRPLLLPGNAHSAHDDRSSKCASPDTGPFDGCDTLDECHNVSKHTAAERTARTNAAPASTGAPQKETRELGADVRSECALHGSTYNYVCVAAQLLATSRESRGTKQQVSAGEDLDARCFTGVEPGCQKRRGRSVPSIADPYLVDSLEFRTASADGTDTSVATGATSATVDAQGTGPQGNGPAQSVYTTEIEAHLQQQQQQHKHSDPGLRISVQAASDERVYPGPSDVHGHSHAQPETQVNRHEPQCTCHGQTAADGEGKDVQTAKGSGLCTCFQSKHTAEDRDLKRDANRDRQTNLDLEPPLDHPDQERPQSKLRMILEATTKPWR